jgi:hypothetical protein
MLTFGVQTVHEALHHVNLVLDRKIDEVRIDDNMERRTQLTVVFQEECGRDPWTKQKI